MWNGGGSGLVVLRQFIWVFLGQKPLLDFLSSRRRVLVLNLGLSGSDATVERVSIAASVHMGCERTSVAGNKNGKEEREGEERQGGVRELTQYHSHPAPSSASFYWMLR